MWDPPKFNKRMVPVSPDDRRGFFRKYRRSDRPAIRGVKSTASSNEQAKIVGGLMMFFAALFSLTFLVYNMCEFLGYALSGYIPLIAIGCFFASHIILVAGEFVMEREVWRSGTSMLMIWVPIGVMTIIAIIASVTA